MVVPYNSSAAKKDQVAAMFDNIAPRYDFLNQLLSMGIHKGWRKKAVALLKDSKPMQILDIATGTGDFAIEVLKLSPRKVTGVDISEGMLQVGKEKIKKMGVEDKIELRLADSEKLPFSDNTFDAITVGFGVRNFEHLEKGLSSMLRVLKPGGKAVILEFSRPRTFPVKQIYAFYFRYLCPLAGRLFSKDNRAYTYLNESVMVFPEDKEFLSILEKTGFKQCSQKRLTFGIATIYEGKK